MEQKLMEYFISLDLQLKLFRASLLDHLTLNYKRVEHLISIKPVK